MGHNTKYTVIDLGYRDQKEKEQRGYSLLDEELDMQRRTDVIQGWEHAYMRSIPQLFDSKKQALDYISKKLDEDGWDDMHSYSATYMAPRSSKLDTLEKRLDAEKAKLEEYKKAHSVITFKAEFVGCPGCKSKLAKKQLMKIKEPNRCPLCESDLRGKTTLETINRYEKNIGTIKKDIHEEEKHIKQNPRKSKFDKQAKLLYIVTDIHE